MNETQEYRNVQYWDIGGRKKPDLCRNLKQRWLYLAQLLIQICDRSKSSSVAGIFGQDRSQQKDKPLNNQVLIICIQSKRCYNL